MNLKSINLGPGTLEAKGSAKRGKRSAQRVGGIVSTYPASFTRRHDPESTFGIDGHPVTVGQGECSKQLIYPVDSSSRAVRILDVGCQDARGSRAPTSNVNWERC
jgi:hypothetical protein